MCFCEERHCSSDLELLTVKCRPFYFPREFSVVVVTAVYIPPDANAKLALSYVLMTINKQQNAYPESVFIIAGYFNHATLKTVLPKFDQHVKFATRRENTLDCVYSNIAKGYRTFTLLHLGKSDHQSLFLAPAYSPVNKKQCPTNTTVKTLPDEASLQLQDCFKRTDCVHQLFYDQNIEIYATTVLSYIRTCVKNVSITKTIRVFPNRKPWMNCEVQLLLKERNAAFRSGNKEQYSIARHNLKKGIQ